MPAVTAIEGALNAPSSLRPSVVTIGNFDGVHLGHRALIDAARALAAPTGAHVVALTFDPSPRDVMQPGHNVPSIQTLADRVALLHEAGCDAVVVEPFTTALAQWEAERFATTILADQLGAVGVVVGWDFRFGARRRGDAALLRATLGVPVVTVEAVTLGDVVVSSTAVRSAVLDGRVDDAARLLGRPHELCGPVVLGDQRGRTIGFPTANVLVSTPLRPPNGVYAVRARLADGRSVGGVANLGVRPTFGASQASLEVHLFDLSEDLYGQELRVGLVKRLREERRFAGIDALVAQIRLDAAQAREELG